MHGRIETIGPIIDDKREFSKYQELNMQNQNQKIVKWERQEENKL